MTFPTPETVDLSKYIEVRNGRAQIRGRRLPVAFVASAERANHLSISELSYQFTLSEEQTLAALLYYREHKTDIDAQDAEDNRHSMEMHQRYARKPGQ